MPIKVERLNREKVCEVLPVLRAISNSEGVYWKDNNPDHDFNHGILFVARDKKNIIGYSTLVPIAGHWCLRGCVVLPKYRGRNIQCKLIKSRCSYALAKNCKSLLVWVKPDNKPSLINLQKEGFKIQNVRPRKFYGTEHIKLNKPI